MTAQQTIQPDLQPQPYRFTQRDYLLLAEHGAFAQVAKAELIEGEIVVLNAQYSRHVGTQTNLLRALANACDRQGSDIQAWIEGSLTIDDTSMPEPDLFLSRGLPDNGPVTLDLIIVIVEVADTTLREDLGCKLRVYVRGGVPEYWVADVNARVIHRMWLPEGDGYARHDEIGFGQELAAATIPWLRIATDQL